MRIQELMRKLEYERKSGLLRGFPRGEVIELADGSTSQYERNTCAGYLV